MTQKIFGRIKKKLYLCTRKWDGSSVGLERMLDRHEVTSSILVRPTEERLKGVLFSYMRFRHVSWLLYIPLKF